MSGINYHRSLATYFVSKADFLDGVALKKPYIRKCSELPWQQLNAELWDELAKTLCDPDFIDSKCKSGLRKQLDMDCRDAISIGCVIIEYFPACPVKGSFEPMEDSHFTIKNTIPKKCLLCPHYFETDCYSRIEGKHTVIDYGPCKVDAPQFLIEFSIFEKTVIIPNKCTTCENFNIDLTCSEDKDIWGYKSLDFSGLDPNSGKELPQPKMELDEYLIPDIEGLISLRFNLHKATERVRIIGEGDFDNITMEEYQKMLEEFENQIPDNIYLEFSYFNKTDLPQAFRLTIAQIMAR